MTKEEIQQLYREQILPESKNPYHFGKREEGVEMLLANNPMCGDKYHLYVNGMDEMHFDGFGCALSKASTSIMIRLLENKGSHDARELCEKFIGVLRGDYKPDDLPDGLRILAELRNFDGRIDCIQLSWKLVLDYLIKKTRQS